jgi:hypothetical protein
VAVSVGVGVGVGVTTGTGGIADSVGVGVGCGGSAVGLGGRVGSGEGAMVGRVAVPVGVGIGFGGTVGSVAVGEIAGSVGFAVGRATVGEPVGSVTPPPQAVSPMASAIDAVMVARMRTARRCRSFDVTGGPSQGADEMTASWRAPHPLRKSPCSIVLRAWSANAPAQGST